MSVASMLYLGVGAVALLLLVCYFRMQKFLKCMFFTAFTGVGALGLVWIIGRFIDMPVGITPFSLLVSGVLGIPGVVGMLLFQLI